MTKPGLEPLASWSSVLCLDYSLTLLQLLELTAPLSFRRPGRMAWKTFPSEHCGRHFANYFPDNRGCYLYLAESAILLVSANQKRAGISPDTRRLSVRSLTRIDLLAGRVQQSSSVRCSFAYWIVARPMATAVMN